MLGSGRFRIVIAALAVMLLLVLCTAVPLILALPDESRRVDTAVEVLPFLHNAIRNYARDHAGDRPKSYEQLMDYASRCESCPIELRERLRHFECQYHPHAVGEQMLASCYIQFRQRDVLVWLDASGNVKVSRVWRWPVWKK